MIEFTVKERAFNMVKAGGKEKRYIAALKSQPKLTTEEICRRVAAGSTLSEHEVALAIAEIEEVALSEMEYGRSVQLGNIGFLQPRLKAVSCDTAEEVDSQSVKKVEYYFCPSKRLAAFLRKLTIRKTEN